MAVIGRSLAICVSLALGVLGTACMKSDDVTQEALPAEEFTVFGKTAGETFEAGKDAALAQAVCGNDLDAIGKMLREGANPNALSEDRSVSVLAWSMACQSPAGMEALLRAKADPNARLIRLNPNGDPYGENLVTIAAGIARPQYLQLLLKYGGDPNSRVTDGTALRTAVQLGTTDGYTNYYLLLNAGADPEMAYGIVMEVLYLFGKYDKVAELLDRGYDYRLDRLAWAVQHHARTNDYPQDGGDERELQRAAAAKVKTMLEQRGIHFPVSDDPPSYEDEIKLEQERLAENAKKPGGLLLNP